MSDRLALIIANSEFDDPKLSRLKTPGRDAEALAQVLEDPAIGGFNEVMLLVDETEPVVRRRIARLYHRRKRGDLLLLYYSGHGIRDERSGELYLATRDTEMDIASATALGAAFVRGQIDKSDSRRKVVVLDCCHSGAFAKAKAALGSSAGTREAFAGNGYSRVILTGSNALEFAWEGDKLLGEAETSVFTHFLVESLRTSAADLNGDGQISLDELYEYVYEQVVASGRSKQTPQKWAQKVEGRIIIARRPSLSSTLFISYARKDVEFAQRLDADLQRHGVTTWIDELGTRTGEDWLDRIAAAIEGCKAMLVILSPDSAASKWVQRELVFADQEGKRILPLLHRPCELPAWFVLRFGNVQRADFSRGSYETNLVELLALIKQVLGLTVATLSPLVKVERTGSRPDVLTITSPVHLELVRVPAGEFLMGSDLAKDEEAWDDEQPQRRVHVSEFYIGKTPVTSAQYAVFVRATKHEMPKHEVPKHWKKGEIPSGKENHPVVNVSWDDAVAFCRWLSQETGKNFRLPTEVEWEKAARGTDGRIYPWGDRRSTAELCNFDNNVRGITPVGRYSLQGDSPYGCADMAGNVWEWTQSLGKGYPYDATDGREDLKAKGSRVLRGGAFLNEAGNVRCAYRDWSDPSYCSANWGFRVMVASPVHL
jgi:formylglycine-generating enzyme required for sulfatase activity/uncharacterized caspase-like protein